MSGGSEGREVTLHVNVNVKVRIEHGDQTGGARAANRPGFRGNRGRQVSNEGSERRTLPTATLDWSAVPEGTAQAILAALLGPASASDTQGQETRAPYHERAGRSRGRGRVRNRGRARMARRAESEYELEQAGNLNPDAECAVCGAVRCSCNGHNHSVNSDHEQDAA